MKLSDIKPCPHCGTKPEFFTEWLNREKPNKKEYYIECQHCLAGLVRDTKKAVIIAWNLRT